MTGRGALPNVSVRPVASLLEGVRPAAGAGGLCVTGSRRDPAGRHASGWLILVAVRGEDGAFTQVSMTPEEARRQAAELIDMADVLEGITW